MSRWLRLLAMALGVGTALGIVAVVAAYLWLGAVERDESAQVEQLRAALNMLDQEVREDALLRDDIQLLLARKQIIEVLHMDRVATVRLLEHVARQRPDGITLTGFTQERFKITLAGRAASLDALWKFIKNLESSHLEHPELIEVRSGEFSLSLYVRRLGRG